MLNTKVPVGLACNRGGQSELRKRNPSNTSKIPMKAPILDVTLAVSLQVVFRKSEFIMSSARTIQYPREEAAAEINPIKTNSEECNKS